MPCWTFWLIGRFVILNFSGNLVIPLVSVCKGRDAKIPKLLFFCISLVS